MESVNGHHDESAPGDRAVHRALDRARDAFARGDLEVAEAACAEGLAEESDFPPLLEIAGVVACRSGRTDLGMERFAWLVELTPDNPSAHFNLGNAYLESRRWKEAAEAFARADELAPGNTEILIALGTARRNSGDLDGARDALERAVAASPQHVAGLNALATTLAELGRPDAASELMQRALAIEPRSEPLRLNAGNLLLEMAQYRDAARQFELALTITPRNADARVGMATAQAGSGDFEGAIHHFRRALRYEPHHAQARYGLVDVLEHEGHLDQAEALIDDMPGGVAHDPNLAFLKARLRVRRGDDPSAATLLEAIDLQRLPDTLRSRVAAELGSVLDRLGRNDDAWVAFSTANDAMAHRWSRVAPGPNRFVARTRAVAEVLAAGELAAVPKADAVGPVFVLGFPRSGTTLLGRMLDAHPAFATADEIPALLECAIALETTLEGGYPSGLGTITTEQAAAARERYLGAFPKVAPARLVDKMPLNMIHGALIPALFGDAPIVMLERDPRDVCLSCFMQPFDINSAMANFLALDTTVALYTEVMGLWEQLVASQQLNVHRVRYESLVADPASELAALCDFLGVAEEPAMLEFHQARKSTTTVRTPSYRQIQTGLTTSAIGRWKHYRSELEPWLGALQPFVERYGFDAPSPEETPS